MKYLFILLLALSPLSAYADIEQAKEAYFIGDYSRAMVEFVPLAEQGDTYAQIKVGQLYENGWGTDINYEKARQWYEKAALADDPLAHVALAKLYGYGRGVSKNFSRVQSHLLKAADLGYSHAYYILGELHNDDFALGHNDDYALEYYILAAEHNSAASLINGHFRTGTGQWFRLITPTGVALTRKYADAGNIYAQFNTGLRYYFGEGVEKNHQTAENYFLMAADAGNAEAQNYLAQNRVMENPAEFDKIFVDKWFFIAAENGNPDARANQLRIEADMTGEQIKAAHAAAAEFLKTQKK
ncbi:MAG: sel1 repeat family protein [Alphaproteobacteria bacterium]|nr:sel1 repeat family protein [Alphaproteobacteria bacterium]HPF47625.1 tetratricopeptide repeat protein [Emcibacteraceae bacterium]HRW28398.1 tetratricopeptide repeat protein [Emcibacteraceae bacterium]